ncbi:MAG: hypothetical protein GYB32_02235 [Algicola sp.]|nr:hypothetical protein [Algicola sp.]
MTLSNEQVEFIENNLKLYGIESKDLRDDLTDHICSYLETSESEDFDSLYQEALQKFGGYTSFQNLQRETNIQKFSKELTGLNKVKFIMSCLATLIAASSLVFKMMHWPYANALLIGAIGFFVVVVLPVHFYYRYRKANYQYS